MVFKSSKKSLNQTSGTFQILLPPYIQAVHAFSLCLARSFTLRKTFEHRWHSYLLTVTPPSSMVGCRTRLRCGRGGPEPGRRRLGGADRGGVERPDSEAAWEPCLEVLR